MKTFISIDMTIQHSVQRYWEIYKHFKVEILCRLCSNISFSTVALHLKVVEVLPEREVPKESAAPRVDKGRTENRGSLERRDNRVLQGHRAAKEIKVGSWLFWIRKAE